MAGPGHELWLGAERQVPSELGFGVTMVPGDVQRYLTGDFEIEPFTGFACPRVSYGETLSWFTLPGFTTSAAFVIPGPIYLPSVARVQTGTWSIGTLAELQRGQGCLLAFRPYAGRGLFRIGFGGRFTLELYEGRAALYDGYTAIQVGELWSVDEWAEGSKWLHLYCVGERLCVRPWRSNRGFSVVVTGTGTPPQALGTGPISISGTDFLTFAAVAEGHASSFWLQHAPITMLRTATATPQVAVLASKASWDSVTASVVTPDGLPWTSGRRFCWRVEGSLAVPSSPNLYLAAVRVRFPSVYDGDGSEPVDVLADGSEVVVPAETGVREQLALDPRQSKLEFELKGLSGETAIWRGRSLKGEWKPGGERRTIFYTGDHDYRQNGRVETVAVTAETAWSLLRHGLWTGGKSYGGWRLGDAYANAVAGVGSPELVAVVEAGDYVLPDEDVDARPLFDFRPEQSVEDVLTYLWENFGSRHLLRFEADGALHVRERPSTVFQWQGADLEFLLATPAATETELGRSDDELPIIQHIAGGTSMVPRQLEWSARTSDEQLRNVVTVVGYDKWDRPLVATATDWPSINDPEAENYVGTPRPLIIIDAGLTTLAVVEWVCRQVYQRVRARRQVAQFRSIWIDGLLPGDLVRVEGSGLARVQSMQTTWSRSGRYGLCDYEVELES